MKGYKAFNSDLTCRGFQFEIGKEYKHEGVIKPCRSGFHFCKSLADCYNFYDMSDNTRICEVEALGEVKTDDEVKFVTDRIKIVAEVENPREKSNASQSSSGYCNSGNCNSGNCNSGIFNTDKNPKIKIFDAPSDWTMNDWYKSDARYVLAVMPYTHSEFVWANDMTDEEKEKHPEHKTIGGYVKVIVVTADDRQKWWDNLDVDKDKVFRNLPNFDEKKFCECIGIERW